MHGGPPGTAEPPCNPNLSLLPPAAIGGTSVVLPWDQPPPLPQNIPRPMWASPAETHWAPAEVHCQPSQPMISRCLPLFLHPSNSSSLKVGREPLTQIPLYLLTHR